MMKKFILRWRKFILRFKKIFIPRLKKFIQRYFLLIVFFFVFLLSVLIWYFYFYQKNVSEENSGPPIIESQIQTLADKVSLLVFLPEDEIPTIATVSDPKMLQDQEFFLEAKKGDVVLIYTNAKKAILYDPVANKIITMATINVGNTKKSTELLPELENNQIKVPDLAGENQF